MNPRVSVNICCYNSEKFIKETLESVLRQSFEDFEVVIIDGGSQDNTKNIIKSFIVWDIVSVIKRRRKSKSLLFSSLSNEF